MRQPGAFFYDFICWSDKATVRMLDALSSRISIYTLSTADISGWY